MEDLLLAARARNPAATYLEAIKGVTQKFTFAYQHRAIRILQGGGILYTGHEPPRLLEVAHPPGYPIFIAGVYSLASNRIRSVSRAQVLLDSFCAAAVSIAVGGLFGAGVGFVGGLLIALSPHLAYNSIVPMPDTVAAWPLVAAMLLLPRALAGGRLARFILIGALIGLSCWLRANALLFGVLVALVIWRLRPRLGWKPGLAVLLTSYGVISPITIRNYVVYKAFIPVGWGAGATLVEGIGDYDFANRFDFPRFDRDLAKWDDETIETHMDRERLLEKKAVGVILRHPLWFSSVVVRRALFQWSYDTHTDQTLDTPFHTRIQPPVRREGSHTALRGLVRAAQGLYSTATGRAFSILGALVLYLRNRRLELAVLLTVPFYYFVFQSILHTEYRYCLPVHYLLFPIMGFGIVEGFRWLFRRLGYVLAARPAAI